MGATWEDFQRLLGEFKNPGESDVYLRVLKARIDAEAPFITQGWINLVETGIVGLAAGLAIPPSRRLECSLPVEDRNVCNSVLHTGKMKTEFVRILPHTTCSIFF